MYMPRLAEGQLGGSRTDLESGAFVVVLLLVAGPRYCEAVLGLASATVDPVGTLVMLGYTAEYETG